MWKYIMFAVFIATCWYWSSDQYVDYWEQQRYIGLTLFSIGGMMVAWKLNI